LFFEFAQRLQAVIRARAAAFDRLLHVQQHDVGGAAIPIQEGGVADGIQCVLRTIDGDQEFQHRASLFAWIDRWQAGCRVVACGAGQRSVLSCTALAFFIRTTPQRWCKEIACDVKNV
jgi:hypothetical protein